VGRAEDLFNRVESRGLDYLLELVETGKSEEAFLDFKQSANRGSSRSLDDNDRKTLSRALSAFANSDGGVVIWGVKTDRIDGIDVPQRGRELENCTRFAGLVDEAVSGMTLPPVPGVRSLPIPLEDGVTGFVATYIPASPVVPHQALMGNQYLIRAGSSFVPATHSLLAGMFGRRPNPSVDLNFIVGPARSISDSGVNAAAVTITLACVNFGSVVAYDTYLSWKFVQMVGERTSITVTPVMPDRWQLDSLHPRIGTVLADRQNRLPPDGLQEVVKLELVFRFPVTEALDWSVVMGCAGAPRITRNFRVEADRLKELLNEISQLSQQSPPQPPANEHSLATLLMGLS
jgi:hypothetical protein